MWSRANRDRDPHVSSRLQRACFCVSVIWSTLAYAADDTEDPAGLDFFETKIRPVLSKHCYNCHSETADAKHKLKGGLRLDHRDGDTY